MEPLCSSYAFTLCIWASIDLKTSTHLHVNRPMKLAGVTGRALSTETGSISKNSPSPNGEGDGVYLNSLSAICTSKPLVKIPVVAYLNNISLVSSMRVSPE